MEFTDTHAPIFRFFIGCFVIIASLVFLILMVSAFKNNESVFAQQTNYYEISGSIESEQTPAVPAVNSNSLNKITNTTTQSVKSAGDAVANSTKFASSYTAISAKFVGSGVAGGSKFVAHNFWHGASTAATGVNNGIVFTIKLPFKTLGFVANVVTSNSIIRPSNRTEVPEIDSQLTALYATYPVPTAEELARQIAPKVDATAKWPIHGQVTTQFGVPHRPYQEMHTGLDISSGKRSGVTPVKPFMPGKVLSVIHSSLGLGNHIVVDHGNGLTSVYGHMNSTAAQEGQLVDGNTTLGYEGSTGVSTGTHLHFEIRLNGQPLDPHKYVGGQP